MNNCELDACRAADRAGAILGHVVVGRGPGRIHIHDFPRDRWAEAFGRDGTPLAAVRWDAAGVRSYAWAPEVNRLSKAERRALALALCNYSAPADAVAASMPVGGE